MNRHDRRRDAKLSDFALAEIEIVTPSLLAAWLADDPARERLFALWVTAPRCYGCDESYPNCAVWITAPARLGRRPVRLVALCQDCAAASTVVELRSRIAAAFLRNGFFIRSMRPASQFAEGGAA